MQKNYSLHSLEQLISEYANRGGSIYELIPGTLGLGLTVCTLDGYRTAVIKEFFINPWSSGHTCRFYNVTPEKYRKMINQYEGGTI